MKILKTSADLTNKECYALTMSPAVQKMKNAVGQQLTVAKWCFYQDANAKDGKEQTIVAIMTPEHEVFATNSATFLRDFEQMCDILADDLAAGEALEIKVLTGTSKSGREFITCALAAF